MQPLKSRRGHQGDVVMTTGVCDELVPISAAVIDATPGHFTPIALHADRPRSGVQVPSGHRAIDDDAAAVNPGSA